MSTKITCCHFQRMVPPYHQPKVKKEVHQKHFLPSASAFPSNPKKDLLQGTSPKDPQSKKKTSSTPNYLLVIPNVTTIETLSTSIKCTLHLLQNHKKRLEILEGSLCKDWLTKIENKQYRLSQLLMILQHNIKNIHCHKINSEKNNKKNNNIQRIATDYDKIHLSVLKLIDELP